MRRSGWLAILFVGVVVAATMAYRGRQAEARAEARRTRVAAMRSTPAPPVAAEVMARREALLAELHPVTLANCELARVGRNTDGGYLMCRNLIGALETAYSYGIGTEDAWGCQISRTYKVPVHQYDCFSPVRVRCWRGDLRLNAECVGPKAETIENAFAVDKESSGTRRGRVASRADIYARVPTSASNARASTGATPPTSGRIP